MFISYIYGVIFLKMRKLLIGTILLSVSLFLFACSNEEDEGSPGSRAKVITDEMTEIIDGKASHAGRIEIGEQITTEHGTFTLVNRMSDMVESDTEPVNVFVDRIAAFTGDVADSFVEILGKEVLDYIQVNVIAENTTDDIVTFPLLKTKLITNTGEEIDGVDMLMSDFVQNEIRSQVRMNGSFVFVLDETNAADVESVRLVWLAPENEAGEKIGEEVEIEVEF